MYFCGTSRTISAGTKTFTDPGVLDTVLASQFGQQVRLGHELERHEGPRQADRPTSSDGPAHERAVQDQGGLP
jgi:hypothetical protein